MMMKNLLIFLIVVVLGVVCAGIYKFNYLAKQLGHDADGNPITQITKPAP